MKSGTTLALLVGAVLLGGSVLSLWLFVHRGFSARDEPLAAEAFMARRLRLLAIPAKGREAKNPVEATADVIRDGMEHFADHCATCHANDGSGDTEIGRSLYPPAPDLREEPTQSLSDGEIFYIIHNGIRFTGMPAWGPEDPAKDLDSWKLVHFIRHLPTLSPDEIAAMRRLNPKSPAEIEEEKAIRSFLAGKGPHESPGHAH